MGPRNSQTFKTTCSYCGTGCGMIIKKDRLGKAVVEGDPDHPVNQGMLCSKGMNLHYAINDHSDRLLYPQMRWSRSHPLQRVSWDDAMKRAAAVFKSMINKYGPDSVGFYVSGQCLTEEYYLANKLVKGFLGTNNIDTNSRLCMSSAVVGYTKVLGEDNVPISYSDIELADCFFIAGANPAWCHPIIFRRIENHKNGHPDVKIIVVDPRKTQSTAIADLHLQINPGTDVFLYNAIGRLLIENGDIDASFISNYVDGFEDYRKGVFENSIDEVSRICGVSVEDIALAARYIAESKGFLTLWAMGLNQSGIGVQKNIALLSLNVITGHIGKPGSGPFSLTGQPNAMGGREVGGMASLLATHHDLSNPDHRAKVANFWGVEKIQDKPGLTATQMIDALEEGKLKAIWIICTNPLVSLPNQNKVEKALKNARFVVVQDISSQSQTIEFADLVLPAAGHFEKEGTMTNSERRISYLEKAIEAPGEAAADSEILIRFAKAMDFKGFEFENAAQIFDEHAQLTKGTNIDISDLSYNELKQQTVQWPYVNGKSQERLLTDHKFFTKNQRAKLYNTSKAANVSELPGNDYPLILTTGRIRDQWHSMTKTGKVSRLNQHVPVPKLEIHPADAKERQLNDQDIVWISSCFGKVQTTIQISNDIKQGSVFLPMHWGKTNGSSLTKTNVLTSSLIDPISKEPDFKFTAVEVSKFKKKQERIAVVGAGAAAYRFINTYRQLNAEDDIKVFSKEPYPFYNRVLLPDYVNDHLTWESLEKFKKGEIEKLNIDLYVNTSIEGLDAKEKYITDQYGQEHHYDKLILATGSKAFVPPNSPIDRPGVFTMRNRKNADDLKDHLKGKGHVLIIGGGLLGLELAASLNEVGIEITIVQLATRLMERQLDNVSSEMLMNFVETKGIHVFINDQVDEIESKKDDSLQVRLKSGQELKCNAAVYAIGTRPNTEIAKEAGLDCGRGVLVNEYLQTSDPDIYAMGEIAEFNHKLNGITAAAEAQADIAARYLNGDLHSMYQGTISMNILKFSDLDLCSLGNIEIPSNDPTYEEIIFMDKAKNYYKRCIVKDDRLVGAILLGDKNEFAEYKRLIEERTELRDKRDELLRSGGAPKPVIGKLVCSCNSVGQGNLEQLIEGGCEDFNALCQQSGAGLGCGSCKPEVQQILNEKMLQEI